MQFHIKKGLTGSTLYMTYESSQGKVEEQTDITSCISLKAVYEDRLIGEEDVKKIVRSMVSFAQMIDKEGKNQDKLLLDPNYIFMNSLTKEMIFIYSEGVMCGIQDSLLELFDYIAQRLDYNDYKAVRLVYGMYSLIIKGDYNIIALLGFN